jgi:hypothetical protein
MIGPGCVALVAQGEPSQEQAEALVRAALTAQGRPVWDTMEIDLFPGGSNSLIIACPADGQPYIADWALRFILEKYNRG